MSNVLKKLPSYDMLIAVLAEPLRQMIEVIGRGNCTIDSCMVGLAQMVRASDCGPEGRRFDPDIPPQVIFIISRSRGLAQLGSAHAWGA